MVAENRARASLRTWVEMVASELCLMRWLKL